MSKLKLLDWCFLLAAGAAVGLASGVADRVFGISVPAGVIGALAGLAAIAALSLRGKWPL